MRTAAQVDKTASPAAPQVDSTRATPPAAQTPAPTKLSDPTAIAVSASTVPTAQAKIETGTKPEATPDENPDHRKPAVATVKDIDTSKNTTRPTLRLPKLPTSRPGTTPKNPKLPSIREGLKSIPGLGARNAPGATGTGSGPIKETVGTGNGGTAESGAHAGPSDHANSGDHGKSGDNHSGSNAA